MRRAPFRTGLLVVCAVLTVAGAAPAGRVEPRPVEVSEAPDASDGELAVEPAQVGLTLPAGTAELAELRVVNGADRTVSLAVEAVPVGAGRGGAPVVPAAGEPVPSAADWVALPAAEVHLDPSEAAAFRPAVTVPEGTPAGGYLTAVRFSEDASDGLDVSAFVLVEVPGDGEDGDGGESGSGGGDGGGAGGGVSVSLRRVDRTSAVATTTLDAGRRGAVDVTAALRVRSWYGTTLVDTPIPATLVLPTVPREREVVFRAPVLPGPYRVTVEDVAAPGVELGPASGSAWLWNPAAVVALALVLLVASAWFVYRAARH